MSKLINIVSEIDSLILSGFYYKNINSYGICDRIKKEDENMIVKYKGFGDYENVFFDDIKGLQSYHRILSQSQNSDAEKGFGSNVLVTETVSLRTVFFGNQRDINDINQDINLKISEEIKALIPNNFNKTFLSANSIQTAFIEIQSTNTDKENLFNDELPGVEFKIAPEHLFFSIEYQLQLRYLNSCKTINCNCDE